MQPARCSNCTASAADVRKILQQLQPDGSVREEWKCNVCGVVTVQQGALSIPSPLAMVDSTLKTRKERIDEYWEERKKAADALTELEQQMLYYYLNKQGLSVIGLDYKIEAALHRKFPPDPKP